MGFQNGSVCLVGTGEKYTEDIRLKGANKQATQDAALLICLI